MFQCYPLPRIPYTLPSPIPYSTSAALSLQPPPPPHLTPPQYYVALCQNVCLIHNQYKSNCLDLKFNVTSSCLYFIISECINYMGYCLSTISLWVAMGVCVWGGGVDRGLCSGWSGIGFVRVC